MKYRLNYLLILIFIALAGCSLAEDITPPASYSSPTSNPTIVTATKTLQPSSTATPKATETVASTSEITPSTPESTTQMDVSPTAQAEMVVIRGKVTLDGGAVIPQGTLANLLLYTSSGELAQTLTTPIPPDGSYEFTNVPADSTLFYLVTVDFNSVTYRSDPANFDGTLFQLEMPVTIFATTVDQSVLTITQAHLQFDFSTAGQVQVMVLYVVTNPSGKTVVVPSDGSNVPFIQIPAGAENINYQLAQSSSPLLNAANGFALLPGADLQYGIITSFTIPYTNRLVFAQLFSLPVSSATIIVPEGVKVRSDQLTDAGTQPSTGTPVVTYHLYQASSLAAGSTLTMTISGMPGDKVGFVFDQRTWLMIGVGAVGLILIGLGIFLFLRDRKLRKLEDDFEGEGDDTNPDALGEDRDSIMDAIITLDDQFKAGDISKEAYEKRRDELKNRLKNLA
jgi:hypothetical protein